MVCPSTYFAIYGLLRRRDIGLKKGWWHFILPIGYFLSQMPFYLAPLSVKYNAYIGAYYSNFEYAYVPDSFDYSYHFIKDVFDWLVLFSFLLYTVLSIRLVLGEKHRLREIGTALSTKKYLFTRNTVFILLILFVVIFIVYYNYDDDGGDHYLSIFHTLIAFLTTYVLITESRFFEKSWIADKYESLSHDQTGLDLETIEAYVDKNQYFLKEKASLKDLANLLNTHPNHISKIINQGKDSNFNEFINQKRVKFSQIKLLDQSLSHLTIEAIGTSVGFKSKSAFYMAFKKYTGVSPSAYIKRFSPKL
ncbi:helix-turn-helix domain-containing protein [Maribacter litopenaei]|uniref:Helix-turn-helix domain-containing protein n=1 Tax=Maribacter litopenaei TaxID=2976127 RepID=A0ABY5Y8F4_9FLAO|nr:helix-turn-helix domain-containing protein [Maribacter litopenaei]UWX54647.1 helix-turn-helix domain-containing protein [Maribacter litopenaei]